MNTSQFTFSWTGDNIQLEALLRALEDDIYCIGYTRETVHRLDDCVLPGPLAELREFFLTQSRDILFDCIEGKLTLLGGRELIRSQRNQRVEWLAQTDRGKVLIDCQVY